MKAKYNYTSLKEYMFEYKNMQQFQVKKQKWAGS